MAGLRASLYRHSSALDDGSGLHGLREACDLRDACIEAALVSTDRAMQIVGREAIARGHPLERLVRDARALASCDGGGWHDARAA